VVFLKCSFLSGHLLIFQKTRGDVLWISNIRQTKRKCLSRGVVNGNCLNLLPSDPSPKVILSGDDAVLLRYYADPNYSGVVKGRTKYCNVINGNLEHVLNICCLGC